MPFLSTPSARRATAFILCALIHKLFLSTPSARRATVLADLRHNRCNDFYPRPPRGGRPPPLEVEVFSTLYFYPRPPRGGRPWAAQFVRTILAISIHAIRVEGDPAGFVLPFPAVEFLSTPSARRATGRNYRPAAPSDISIHALREEGDLCYLMDGRWTTLISIHALREEGDGCPSNRA